MKHEALLTLTKFLVHHSTTQQEILSSTASILSEETDMLLFWAPSLSFRVADLCLDLSGTLSRRRMGPIELAGARDV